MDAKFFATPAEWAAWLEEHHGKRSELLVGFYKRDSGKPSMTWHESVDVALCFGWIDGVRRRIDDQSYSIRFTPRKATSIWSAVNCRRVGELKKQGLMRPAGLKAFEAREKTRSGVYSFEQQEVQFSPEQERRLRAAKPAWEFFEARPAWYRKAATWWVVSAKQEKTRERRLAQLIEDSENGRTLAHLTRAPQQS